MARRSSSPRLIGRDGELADLVEAVRRDDPERRVVLVAGEAGIGKSRLLAELVARVEGAAEAAAAEDPDRSRMRVVRGSCIQLGDGDLPFAPVLEILDALRIDVAGSVRVKRLRAQLAGAGEPAGTGSAVTRTSRFLEIHDVLVAATGPAGLVVMIDDLHWADPSTLELVRYLARRLRGSRIVLVAAYRSDELHRRHPLRPVLAELSRGFVRDRIDLGPLGAEDVASLIHDLGSEISPDLAGEIATQAEGNPFHIEELVALDRRSSKLPTSLRDVLLARLATVDPAVLAVLGSCAVIGRDVDAPLVAAVLGLDMETVSDGIDAAVDRSILVPVAGRASYRFRHALLAEAVREDLLPSARVDLHRRIARVLHDRPDLRSDAPTVAAAELALHLDGAGDVDGAIEAYLSAANLAFGAIAWAEAAASFERASELAARTGGSTGPDARLLPFVRSAGYAFHWSGDTPRSVALLRDWIETVDRDGDRVSAAAFRLTLARIFNDVGEEAASRTLADEARRILPPDEHTPVGLDVLIGASNTEWIAGRIRSSLALAERAVAGADELGDPSMIVTALVSRGTALVTLGHIQRGLADFGRIDDLQAEHGWLDDWGFTITNVGASLIDAGLPELSLALWLRGLELSQEFDKVRSWDPWNLAGLATCHFLTGRWRQADAAIEDARGYDVPGMPTMWREIAAARLAAGRGDLEAADRSIDLAFLHGTELEGDFPAHLAQARADRSDAADDPADRLQHLEAGIRTLAGLDDVVVRSQFAAEAAGAAADLSDGLRGRHDQAVLATTRERAMGYAQLAADIAAGRLVPGSAATDWTRANDRLAAAESARAQGHDDPTAWADVVAAHHPLGMPPRLAYAELRLASALLHAGDRAGATAAVRRAHALATEVGMTVLDRRITTLARAGRLALEDVSPAQTPAVQTTSGGHHWGLSDREREVLTLVAAGRTNGEIGAALFITTKTASVHVTHILDKLGVSSRTEAALLASREGLGTPD